jgi:hypothetical protein
LDPTEGFTHELSRFRLVFFCRDRDRPMENGIRSGRINSHKIEGVMPMMGCPGQNGGERSLRLLGRHRVGLAAVGVFWPDRDLGGVRPAAEIRCDNVNPVTIREAAVSLKHQAGSGKHKACDLNRRWIAAGSQAR